MGEAWQCSSVLLEPFFPEKLDCLSDLHCGTPHAGPLHLHPEEKDVMGALGSLYLREMGPDGPLVSEPRGYCGPQMQMLWI